MSDTATPETPEPILPPSLRLLKWLVVALTLTMIGGVITVVALLVTRMPQGFSAADLALPETITLPEGVGPVAVTWGKGWTGVVTTDDRILIFRQDGTLHQEIRIDPVENP